ncbi:DUF4245 domain-containing protein [Cumulibacter manganitolerans]|uniref:DUF4245 domain-containing protein n=1 Tax=Cumulibacter manganitolerans TaxID=1884992 RepID=UPI00129656B8|nr:DUF4245 domain-containing protein [Cumulibacter manganitolerans]
MADTQPYRPRKRGFESFKDMMWSLIPIVVLVLGFVYFCGPRDSQVSTVDPRGDVRGAAQVVGYPLVAPDSLSEDWRSTASTLLRKDGDVVGVSIGYRTPKDQLARYVISSGTRDEVIGTALADAKVRTDPDGSAVELAGLGWVPVRTTAGHALVAQGEGFVAVVAGTASYAELRELAGAVQPPAKDG